MDIFQVDAFCEGLFSGNPAAVCPLTFWPDDQLLQSIAAENNLAETAFFVREEDKYRIRWFTPAVEVDLCGHATLASAHVLFTHLGFNGDTIVFKSRSGELPVRRQGDDLTLNFPVDSLQQVPVTEEMCRWFSVTPAEAFMGRSDFMLVFESESQIRGLQPNFETIAALPKIRGVIATAKGDTVDFVSRFFAPQAGVNEDPATGSAHTTLTPYWSKRLGKRALTAWQLSHRKGFLKCHDRGERIEISGKAKTFFAGKMFL